MRQGLRLIPGICLARTVMGLILPGLFINRHRIRQVVSVIIWWIGSSSYFNFRSYLKSFITFLMTFQSVAILCGFEIKFVINYNFNLNEFWNFGILRFLYFRSGKLIFEKFYIIIKPNVIIRWLSKSLNKLYAYIINKRSLAVKWVKK